MQVADLFASLGLKVEKEQWDRGSELIEGVKKGLEVLGAFEAVKVLGEFIESTAEAAIGAGRLAQKIGVTTEAVQELGYAASTTGVSQEELQTGFMHLARGMEEMRNKGTGPAADGFRGLGISMRDLRDATPDEVLGRVATKFQSMPDGAKKTALAMDLFGRSGANLIPLLNKGGDGIEELRKEADELGIVIDDKTTKGFEGLEETTLKVKGALTGLKNQAVVALLPIVSKMADSLFEWVKANHEIIQSSIQSAVEGLITVVDVLAQGVGIVVKVFQWFSEHTKVARAVLISLGIVMGAFAAAAAIDWAIAFAPVVAVVAIIAGLILVIEDVWDSITTGKGVAADVFGWLGDRVDAVAGLFRDVGGSIKDFFVGIGDGVTGAMTSIFDWVGDKVKWIEDKIDGVFSAIGDAASAVSDFFTGGDGASTPEEVASGSAAWRSAFNVPSLPDSSSSSSSTTVSPGAVAITVNATGDAKAISDQINASFSSAFGNVLRGAHAATGGADR